jgi:pimeloyl-ACP methyl ester carboxylesterase
MELHTGWHALHPDVSLNFQLNRWAAYGGARWIADVRPVLPRLTSYPAWRDELVALGERAAGEGRALDAALHFRSAEFFMGPEDPRKEPLRRRLLRLFREAAGVPASARLEVRFGPLRLPVWRLDAGSSRTVVVFGGFDSYVEEFFPILLRLRDLGRNVVAFEGPGQGSVLEEQGAPMTRDWHGPVGAELDALGLDGVTLVGVSLGGCLAIRAAAFEPRVHRVVAFDVLTDFLACLLRQLPRAMATTLRAALAVRAGALVDRAAAFRARRSPVVAWGIAQAQRVFGRSTPFEAFEAARSFHTRDVSARVRKDVLLLAGAEDHYVPLEQLGEQACLLTSARSISARVFTSAEQGQAHCQVGNLPLALDTMVRWEDDLARDRGASQPS